MSEFKALRGSVNRQNVTMADQGVSECRVDKLPRRSEHARSAHDRIHLCSMKGREIQRGQRVTWCPVWAKVMPCTLTQKHRELPIKEPFHCISQVS